MRSRRAVLEQDQKLTIGELMELYFADREIENKNVEKMRYQWKALKPHFEHLQPADLEAKFLVQGKNRTRCHAYAVARTEQGRARDTVHSELSLLRTAMAWAVSNKKIAVAPKVWVPPKGKGRDTSLTEEEMGALLKELVRATWHVRLFLILAMNTAARMSAILELTWDERDVNFKTGVIDFRRKSERDILDTSHIKERAVVDMTPLLREIMLDAYEWRTPKTNRVIEWNKKPVESVKKSVKACFVRAGLTRKYLGAHALRHTLATWAHAHGVDPQLIQRLLGHKKLDTTLGVYVEHKAGALLKAASVVSDVLQLSDETKSDYLPKASREAYERARNSAAQKRRSRETA